MKFLKFEDKTLLSLLLITFLIHFGVVLFMHFTNFQPFSGGYGDYVVYQRQAEQVAERIRQGNFSLEGIGIGHYYSVIIGYIYALTLPDMIIGRFFGVLLAVASAFFIYLIILEVGKSKKWAFLIGLFASLYPSYLFYGSLLLKDTLVVPFVLAGLLLTLKIIKNFSWKNFLILCAVLAVLIHFRFYVGFALLFTIIISWPLVSKLNLKERFSYWVVIIIILGYIPQILGLGYYGYNVIRQYLNPKIIIFYREAAYASKPSLAAEDSSLAVEDSHSSGSEIPVSVLRKTIARIFPNIESETPANVLEKAIVKIFPNIEKAPSAHSSSIEVKTEIDNPVGFSKNYAQSFINVLLGPLPWQMQNYRQLFALLETLPWYFLLFFVIKGAFMTLKQERVALPLLVFSIISLGVLTLFITNFGIITRIRMPSFMALCCLIPVGFKKFLNT